MLALDTGEYEGFSVLLLDEGFFFCFYFWGTSLGVLAALVVITVIPTSPIYSLLLVYGKQQFLKFVGGVSSSLQARFQGSSITSHTADFSGKNISFSLLFILFYG